MESVSFVLKTFLFTVVIVWLCQLRVGNKPIERHFTDFVHTSMMTEPIEKVAEGSRRLASDSWAGIQNLTGWKSTKTPTAEPRKASSFKWNWGSGKSNATGKPDRDQESE